MVDLVAVVSGLPVRLPPGGLAVDGDSGEVVPWLWRSDAPPTVDLVRQIRAVYPTSGLWPLLLDAEPLQYLSGPAPRMLDADEAGLLLAGWWHQWTHGRPDQATAPFGQRWPRLAAPGTPRTDPDEHANTVTRHLLDDDHSRSQRWRLGLVAAPRSADVPAVIGWSGAVNYDNDQSRHSAVLRSWEDRFGTRLVAMEQATLTLSVAAPPADPETALHLAAEHFAFCPDQLWQGHPHTIDAYAPDLLDAPHWTFWWD